MVIFLTKHNLRTPTVRHGKTGPEQILNTSSNIKTTIYTDFRSLTPKPKKLATLSSKHGTYKSTKPFSTTLIPLNRYNFFSQISSKSTAMTIAIQGISFQYPLRPILRPRPIYTILKKRLTLSKTLLQRTPQTRLQTKASIRHRKA